ncbi:MAG: hypothetical protein AABO57_25445 [Acidobacteriota bacterium]
MTLNIDVTLSAQTPSTRVTFAEDGRQEQVVTASPLPDRWVYDFRTNTATGMYSLDESSAELEQTFTKLAEQWRNETAHLSLAGEKANSFAYHQIMAMGPRVLPLIFRELEATTSDWFWALRAIARDKAPVIKPEDRGRVRRIAEIWMDWGKQNGYVSG